jgi:hypothetical protein
MISQTAQGLASLGRNGDSMLVHMSPEEVGGLKQVGDTLGIRMSTNPQTGMPEAFSFGDFFTSFLPTIVGAAVGGPAGGGLMSSMTPILAGAGTGALLAAAKGDDPLMGGLTGGLGGYGGAGLGQKIGASFGGTTAGSMGKLASEGAKQVMGGGAGNLGMFATNLTGATPALGAANFVPGVAQVGSSVGTIPQIGGAANLGNAIPVDKSIASLAGGYTPPPTIGQNLGDLGTGVKNLTGFGDMSIGDAYKQFTDVGGGSAMDLAMPVGTAVLSGLEPSDLGYGTGNLYEDPDKGKYRGPQGQLNLSDQFDTGLRLAAGGTVQSGGIRDLYGTPDNPATMSSGLGGFGLGRLNNLAGEQAMTQAQTLGYADGGGVVAGERGMNMNDLPTLNVNTGMQSYGGGMGDAMYSFNDNAAMSPIARMLLPQMSQSDRAKFLGSGMGTFFGMQERPKQDYYTSSGALTSSYAKGGYLDGAGDGMSDSIPATIEGKQPARLADGEFVIPADVVSHLGNGSSKAGSKRLYAMLDKVRHARTGNKKQGKEIKAEKYLPA